MGQDAGDKLADAVVNIATVGLAGIEDGKIKKGFGLRNLDETLGEVTGRNAARKVTMEQKDALAVEKAEKAKELENEQKRKEQQDIAASRYAGAVRRTARLQQSSNFNSTLGPAKDFLGI